ncbi:MAG: nickel-dependent lactate racemase [bacterium]
MKEDRAAAGSSGVRERIPWGADGVLEFELPGGWNLLGSMRPASPSALADVETELERALVQPTGCGPLAELARGKRKVAIVVDDISRPTPAYRLMGKVLEHLAGGGVKADSVTLIPGLGVHRPMTREEMEAKAGKANLETARWENHDSRDGEKLVFLGRTRRGTRVYVNRTVAESDLVVLVGTIEPHVHAGFGGGYKNILPGVSGVVTISRNHAICAHPRYFSMIGTEPEKNPMRLDIEEAGRMLKGTVFIVNTVLDQGGGIVAVVAGDPVAAHRRGVKAAAGMYGVRVPRRADVVITGSSPMDLDLRQGGKAIANTLFAAKPGGVIIAAMKCEEGIGSVRIPKFMIPSNPLAAKLVAKLLCLAVTRIAPPGISPEERFAAYFLFRAVLRNRILLYAPSICDELKGKIPIAKVYGDFEEVIREAHGIRPRADVLIFPSGGVTYPVLPERSAG